MSLTTHRSLECNHCGNVETLDVITDGGEVPKLAPPPGWAFITVRGVSTMHFCPGCLPSLSLAVTVDKRVQITGLIPARMSHSRPTQGMT